MEYEGWRWCKDGIEESAPTTICPSFTAYLPGRGIVSFRRAAAWAEERPILNALVNKEVIFANGRAY
jgi:hypothetical protein